MRPPRGERLYYSVLTSPAVAPYRQGDKDGENAPNKRRAWKFQALHARPIFLG